MAWQEESADLFPTRVRPKVRIYDDEQEFAVVPAVFGVRRVPAVALEHAFNKRLYYWRSSTSTEFDPTPTQRTSEFDPEPVRRNLEKLERLVAGLIKSFAVLKETDEDDYTTDRDGNTRIYIEQFGSPVWVSKFRTGSLVRWSKRIHTNDDDENNIIVRKPVGGSFGKEEQSTINSALSDTQEKISAFLSALLDARRDINQLWYDIHSEIVGRDVSDTRPPTKAERAMVLNIFWYSVFLDIPTRIEFYIKYRVPALERLVGLLKKDGLDKLYKVPAIDADTASTSAVMASEAAVAAIFDEIDLNNREIAKAFEDTARGINALNRTVRNAIRILTPVNNKTYDRKYYSGRFGFSYGELDKFISVFVEEARVPQSFNFGDNTVIHTSLLGGAIQEGGNGGIGSLDRVTKERRPRTLALYPGSQTQVIPRYGSKDLALNYRGTSVISFDWYNWGAGEFPFVDAIVQRTNKLLTGLPQWYPSKAVACEETLDHGGDYTVIFSIDDSASMQRGHPISRRQAMLNALDSVFRRIYDLIQDGKKINAYIYGWSEFLPEGTTQGSRRFYASQGITNAINFAGFSRSSPWSYSGTGGYNTTSSNTGVDQLILAINDARTRFPEDRPIYAFYITDSDYRLTEASAKDLATISGYSNVTVRALSIYHPLSSGSMLYQVDSTGNPLYIWASDQRDDTANLSQQILNALDSIVANISHLNPVHALRELMTNTEIGFGIPTELLDNDSFRIAADVCAAESLCCAFTLDDTRDTEQMFQILKRHMDCEVYEHPIEGKIKIKLIRKDYDVDNITSINTEEIGDVSNFTQKYNQREIGGVTVTYRNVDNESKAVTIVNPILREQGHETVKVNFEACPTYATALHLAKRELASRSQPIRFFSVTLPSIDLYPGDPVKVDFTPRGIRNVVMRVQKREVDETGFVTLQLVEDVFDDVFQMDEQQLFIPTTVRRSGWGYNFGNVWGD